MIHKKTFITSILILLLSPVSLWGSEVSCNKSDYEWCYKGYWVNYCKTSGDWNDKKKWVGNVTEEYAPLDGVKLNQKISSLINSEKNPNERSRLEKDLDLTRIGNFDGFKSVEIARIQYRTDMDRIFSCAVIASRIEKTNKVIELISKAGSTDIQKKLQNDIKKLSSLKVANCGENASDNTLNDYRTAVSVSATTEYCIYRNYLDYLQENISTDYSNVIDKEQKIGTPSSIRGTGATIASMASDMSLRARQIERDITRATDTLPKVIVAYREMERTYPIHIMMLIIYDDYLELRQNLNTYLNAVSQLFEKANNAQSANNQ